MAGVRVRLDEQSVPLETLIERTTAAFDVDRSSGPAGRRTDGIGRAVAADLACRLRHATKRQITDALSYRNQGSLHVAHARAAKAGESASVRRKASHLEKHLADQDWRPRP